MHDITMKKCIVYRENLTFILYYDITSCPTASLQYKIIIGLLTIKILISLRMMCPLFYLDDTFIFSVHKSLILIRCFYNYSYCFVKKT